MENIDQSAFTQFLLEMDTFGFYWFWGFIALFSLPGLSMIRYYYKWRRILEDTPITPNIAACAQGYVAISAVADYGPYGPIKAYFSKKPCVWYRYEIREKRGDSNSYQRQSSHIMFCLSDQSGACFIEPKGADEIHAWRQDVWYSDQIEDSFTEEALAGNEHRRKRYKITEWRIEKGDEAYAIGDFRTIKNNTDYARESSEVRKLLLEWKNDPDFIKKHFDANNDGEVEIKEWERAIKLAQKLVKDMRSNEIPVYEIDCLTKPKLTNHPFVITTMAREFITTRSHKFTLLAVLVSVILIPVLIWSILVRFGVI